MSDNRIVGTVVSVAIDVLGWQWGGAYGHTWFVDPERHLTVIALTNTALEGLAGRFPIELRDAIYQRENLH